MKDIKSLVCRLSLENYELKQKNEEFRKAMSSISGILYCVGGPLNDNSKRYSKDQLRTFYNIGQYIIQ